MFRHFSFLTPGLVRLGFLGEVVAGILILWSERIVILRVQQMLNFCSVSGCRGFYVDPHLREILLRCGALFILRSLWHMCVVSCAVQPEVGGSYPRYGYGLSIVQVTRRSCFPEESLICKQAVCLKFTITTQYDVVTLLTCCGLLTSGYGPVESNTLGSRKSNPPAEE